MLQLLLLSALVGQTPERPRAIVVESGPDTNTTQPKASDFPTLRLPDQVTGEAGRPIEITAKETNCKAVYWFCQDDARALRRLDDKTTLFTVPKPGRYRVWAWAVKGDRSTSANMVWVVVTPAVDDPDNPGPQPIPPTPPVPPNPPTPTDTFAKEIQDAYAADVSTNKAVTLGKLVAFYEAVAGHVADKGTKTVGVFLEVYSEAATKLLPEGELVGVRQVIGRRVAAIFPADTDSQIDDATRVKAVAFFKQATAALQAVKK